MRFLLAVLILLCVMPAQAERFSLRCEDGEFDPLLFTIDLEAMKAIYESPASDKPSPGTIVRVIGKSFLFTVHEIGADLTDFIWDDGASQMQIGLRGTPFRRTFPCSVIPLRPVGELFQTLWQKR